MTIMYNKNKSYVFSVLLSKLNMHCVHLRIIHAYVMKKNPTRRLQIYLAINSSVRRFYFCRGREFQVRGF
jgi:hypothetical protein